MQVDEDNTYAPNPAIYAMKILQKKMKGEADKAGFFSEKDVVDYIAQCRREETTP